jgi:hypothetical protein
MTNSRIRLAILIGLCCGAIGIVSTAVMTPGSARYSTIDAVQNPAINSPDQFAWETFVAINQAAKNGSNDALWETWALQEDVFADPNKKPVWPSAEHQPKVLHPSIKLQILLQERLERRSKQLQLFRMDVANPVDKPKAQFIAPNPLSEEVRMNKNNFDFIVGRDLWYLEGQAAAFKDGRPLSFDPESKEVKAHWKELTNPADKSRYHWQVGKDGKTYGLIALHVMTKDLPNWFWATWEHVDNPERCKINGCSDKFGLDPKTGQISQSLLDMLAGAGMGPEWQNYRLTGTQTAFTDSTGRSTLLGNSQIEGRLGIMATSSCITCHAKASVNDIGDRLDIFSADGQSDNGSPVPTWFYNTSVSPPQMKFLQLDFEWSLGLAKPRNP